MMRSPRVSFLLLAYWIGATFLALGVSCEKAPQDPASTFWRWFLKVEKDLRSQEALRGGLIDQAYDQIRKVNEGLAIEIGGDPKQGPTELIISAEGKRELFPLVEQLIVQAPKVVGWKFIALKPALGFDFDHEYDGKHLDPRKLWFQARKPKDAPGMLGLVVFIPGYAEADKTSTVNALFKILDTAMGERWTAETIRYLDVGKLPEDPEKEGYTKLVELPQFIEAYQKKQR